MGLSAANHPRYGKLTATQRAVADLLAQSSGDEVLPFPGGIGRSPTVIVAAEVAIWPRGNILLVCEDVSRPTWQRYWEDYGDGVNHFTDGLSVDDNKLTISAVAPSALIPQHSRDQILARDWQLAIFSCRDPLSAGPNSGRNAALRMVRQRLRSWVLLNRQDLLPDHELGAAGELLASLDVQIRDDYRPIAKPGVILRPSALAERVLT